METIKTLTLRQINLLFDYCRSQKVRYYDVQLELVDHMTNWIENKMHTRGESFSVVFSGIVAQFPGWELKMIVKNKRTLIRKKIGKLFFNQLFSFFTGPKLLITAAIYFLFLLLLPKISSPVFLSLLYIRVLFDTIFKIRSWRKIFTANKDESVKPLLVMKEKGGFMHTVPIILTLIPAFFFKFPNPAGLTTMPLMMSVLYTVFLLMILAIHQVGIKINKQVKADFPQAFTGNQ